MIYAKSKHLFRYYGMNDVLDDLIDDFVSSKGIDFEKFKKIALKDLKNNHQFISKKGMIRITIPVQTVEVELTYTKELTKVQNDDLNNLHYYQGNAKASLVLDNDDILIAFQEDGLRFTSDDEIEVMIKYIEV